jgi:hypothetical protein
MLDLSSLSSLSFLPPNTLSLLLSLTALILTAFTIANNLSTHFSLTTLEEVLQKQGPAAKILAAYIAILHRRNGIYHMLIHVPTVASLAYLVFLSTNSVRIFFGLSLSFEIAHFATTKVALDCIEAIKDAENVARGSGLPENVVALKALGKLIREENWRLGLVNGPCFVCCLVGVTLATG